MSKKKRVSQNYMDMVFHIQPDLKYNKDKQGIVTYYSVHKGFFARIAQIFYKRPKVSTIKLDRLGSSVWSLIDGKNTVYDIVVKMQELYPDEERMLDRVVTFLHTMQVNKLICK